MILSVICASISKNQQCSKVLSQIQFNCGVLSFSIKMDKTRDKYNIKFKNRTASNTSDKRIADAYNKAGAFDVNLITSDDKVVAAHRFVLSMYSKHLAGILRDLGSNGLIISELFNSIFIPKIRKIFPLHSIFSPVPVHLSHEILQKIVQMMYFREVTVPRELSLEMNDAIKFLKIDDTITVDSATLEDNNNPFKEPTAREFSLFFSH